MFWLDYLIIAAVALAICGALLWLRQRKKRRLLLGLPDEHCMCRLLKPENHKTILKQYEKK